MDSSKMGVEGQDEKGREELQDVTVVCLVVTSVTPLVTWADLTMLVSPSSLLKLHSGLLDGSDLSAN